MKRLIFILLFITLISSNIYAASAKLRIALMNSTSEDLEHVIPSMGLTTYISEGSEYISSNYLTSCYPGANCINVGSSNTIGKIAIQLSDEYQITPKRIVISAKARNVDNTLEPQVSVNTNVFTTNTEGYNMNTFTVLEYDCSSISSNLVSLNIQTAEKSAWFAIEWFEIYYETSDPEPVIISDVAGLEKMTEGGIYNIQIPLIGAQSYSGILYAQTELDATHRDMPKGVTSVDSSPENDHLDSYEDTNWRDFANRVWVAIEGENINGFVDNMIFDFTAKFTNGRLAPTDMTTLVSKGSAQPEINIYRAENILHGAYSNMSTDVSYTPFYVPTKINETAKFCGYIEQDSDGKYFLYSNSSWGKLNGTGVLIESDFTIPVSINSQFSIIEGVILSDATTNCGLKIRALKYHGLATGIDGIAVDDSKNVYSADGAIIISATENPRPVYIYDSVGKLCKITNSSSEKTVLPMPTGYYIVQTTGQATSVIVK